jgi:hypothetical protein
LTSDVSTEPETSLGYCTQCKTYGITSIIYSIEANVPYFISERIGIFIPDEVNFKKEGQQETGISISGAPMANCPDIEVGEEDDVPDPVCPFSSHGFDWAETPLPVMECRCNDSLYANAMSIRNTHCYCERAIELGLDESTLRLDNLEIVKVRKHRVPYFKTKITNSEILPIVLDTQNFIHLLTFNIDKYFLGILQTLAVKNVEVSIVVNQSTLRKKSAMHLLDAQSFVGGNLQIRVNKINHAKHAFLDGVYELDLSSINLSFQALHYNNENEASLEFAHPLSSASKWRLQNQNHELRFVDIWQEGKDLEEYCSAKWPEMYEEWQARVERRENLDKLIHDSRRVK